MKKGLKGRRFQNTQELEDAFDFEIGQIARDEYRTCIMEKWPAHWRKCLAHQGNYFEGIHS